LEELFRLLLAARVIVAVRRLAEPRQRAVADLEDEPVALEAQAFGPAVGIGNRTEFQSQRALRAHELRRRGEPRGRADERAARNHNFTGSVMRKIAAPRRNRLLTCGAKYTDARSVAHARRVRARFLHSCDGF